MKQPASYRASTVCNELLAYNQSVPSEIYFKTLDVVKLNELLHKVDPVVIHALRLKLQRQEVHVLDLLLAIYELTIVVELPLYPFQLTVNASSPCAMY